MPGRCQFTGAAPPSSSRQTSATCRDYARAAATLGLQRTGTWVLPQDGFDDSSPASANDDLLERTVRLHVERLGKIAKILADHGSRLGLEVMGPASARPGPGATFVHQYRQLAEQLGELRAEHPNVGVLVDAFHLFAAGEGIEAGFVWGVDSVVWVHVADSANPDRLTLLDHERALPGETGLADCRGLLKRLAEEGYDGPVTVEPLKHCRSLQGLDAWRPLGGHLHLCKRSGQLKVADASDHADRGLRESTIRRRLPRKRPLPVR